MKIREVAIREVEIGDDERKGRWNSVRDKKRPRFGSDFTSATEISPTPHD